ncbi:MAG: hypothetical protein ACYC26_11110 [Phycisphaerales bacterium]
MIVYDPTAKEPGPNVNGWPADFVFIDFPSFSRVFWSNRGCLAIIDEAGDCGYGSKHRDDFTMMLRRGRHLGHYVIIINQSHVGVIKQAREQCSELRIFRIGDKDADDLANFAACPLIRTAHTLPNGHYIARYSDGSAKRLRLW